jgi:methionyl-tRNA formyltransferase
MRIIFTGSGEFGVPTLAALLEARQEIRTGPQAHSNNHRTVRRTTFAVRDPHG